MAAFFGPPCTCNNLEEFLSTTFTLDLNSVCFAKRINCYINASGTSSVSSVDSPLSSPITPSLFPGLKPSFAANPSHRSLPFLLQDWLHGFPWPFTDTSEHIRFLLYIFVFSTFSFLVSCGRLSWLMSAFERTLNSISYRNFNFVRLIISCQCAQSFVRVEFVARWWHSEQKISHRLSSCTIYRQTSSRMSVIFSSLHGS